MCVCVRMYAYINTYIHTYVYIYICMYAHTQQKQWNKRQPLLHTAVTHIKTNRRAAAPRKALTWIRGSTSSSSGRGGSSAGRPRRAPGSMAAPLLPLLPLLLLLPPLPPGRRRPRPRLRGTPPSLPTAPPVLFVPSRREQAISAKLRGFHFF